MEQFVTMDPSERDKFKTDLAAKVNTVTGEFLGVTVTITGLGTIDVPDLAAEKLMASWTAEKDRAVALSNAEQQNRILMSTAEHAKKRSSVWRRPSTTSWTVITARAIW